MKVAVYSTHQFEKQVLPEANQSRHEFIMLGESLNLNKGGTKKILPE